MISKTLSIKYKWDKVRQRLIIPNLSQADICPMCQPSIVYHDTLNSAGSLIARKKRLFADYKIDFTINQLWKFLVSGGTDQTALKVFISRYEVTRVYTVIGSVSTLVFHQKNNKTEYYIYISPKDIISRRYLR